MKKILSKLYTVRYSKEEEKKKQALWRVLCRDYLQQFVSPKGAVLDVAAGHCEFINFIKARDKYALDLDPRIKKYAGKDVKVHIGSATRMPRKFYDKFDAVFMGCLLEHLPSKQAILDLFREVKKVLKKGGRLMILNPNYRFSTSDFWDYFDHLTAVSDRSIVEVLKALDYEIEFHLPKFVPNTIKDRLPKSALLLKLYLRLPFLFPIFGRQMLVVAKK